MPLGSGSLPRLQTRSSGSLEAGVFTRVARPNDGLGKLPIIVSAVSEAPRRQGYWEIDESPDRGAFDTA